MKTNKNIFKLLCTLTISTLLSGCGVSSLEVKQPLVKALPSIKERPGTLEKGTIIPENFDPYTDPEQLKLTTKKGKEDPFSFGSEEVDSIISTNLLLRGIISDGEENYAIVQYRNLSGSLQEGQIGGVSTKLLPKGVKVESIDFEKEKLSLKHKHKLYELKMRQELL